MRPIFTPEEAFTITEALDHRRKHHDDEMSERILAANGPDPVLVEEIKGDLEEIRNNYQLYISFLKSKVLKHRKSK